MFRRTYNAQAKAKEELGVFAYSAQQKSNSSRQWTAEKDFVDANGQTHLHQGVIKYCVQDSMFESALSVGCDVNTADQTGKTALHIACMKGLTGCVDKLLKRGAKFDQIDDDQMTPLMYACRHGHPIVAKSLIKNGADVNQSNARGELALHYSCTNAHEACTELLIKHKSKLNYPDNEDNTPLNIACRTPSVTNVQRLLDAGCRADKVDKLGRSPLHWAILNGNKKIVEVLLEAGASVDETDKNYTTPFIYCIFSNNASVLQLLVDAGCDRTAIDGLNGTALTLAALKGHCDCVKVLLLADEDPDEFSFFGMTALMAAAYESHFDVAKNLLEHGASVNIISRLGFTAVFASICHINDINALERHHLLVLLLQYGADIDMRLNEINIFTMVNGGKNYPMAFAATSGFTSLVSILIQAGSNISVEELQQVFTSNATGEMFDLSTVILPILEYKRTPLTLRALSRLVIRKQLGDKPHEKLHKLPIPKKLMEFINFSDLYDITPVRAGCKFNTQDMMMRMIDVKACGLAALEGTFLFQRVEEPVRRNTPPGPCDCNTCARIAAMHNT